jgi:hypothetical protein
MKRADSDEDSPHEISGGDRQGQHNSVCPGCRFLRSRVCLEAVCKGCGADLGRVCRTGGGNRSVHGNRREVHYYVVKDSVRVLQPLVAKVPALHPVAFLMGCSWCPHGPTYIQIPSRFGFLKRPIAIFLASEVTHNRGLYAVRPTI